ncbi:hypothetical protein ZYGR_0A04200 [Zygosaccharomyces rouxii]|uniref:ZYRO0A09526p n=2 Tax=Zygosaccharomyces rouxii TaxID=4956 RepID=C5DQ87_ZYGRC|nr:uncharacterized protein ZYRO0A09526g [Zygosaccharomyces rouxii]KAH9198633.1 hypothetical protein LQ764DRAFT_139512 [Zygosaccharomyces rouxii]GAV46823.1 hypothetical protein ZYGR_0A04200 [Zygosaccharomyces rouxii]CAR25848.1 ZYRO0A09526p [Zygosaccharomyces rouxii]
MLQGLPLDVVLRIFSLLNMNDLVQVGKCSHLLRQLANHALLTKNVLISAHSNWIRDSLFFDMSRMDLEFIRHDEDEGHEEQEKEDNDEQLLMDMYAKPIMCNNEETLSYMRILQGVHEEDTKLVETDHVTSPDPNDWDAKLEKALKVLSPACSDYSKSSANSTFSELPPRLSNSEWSSPINELNTLSDVSVHGISDCESTSSANSLDKLRSSNKVRDKAALFEKLMAEDVNHTTRSQGKSMKRKSYGLLSHFFPDRSFDTRDRNVSQGYIEELARCNGEPAATTAPGELQDTQANDNTLECTEEPLSKKNYRNNSKGIQRNRLKAFVTQGNRICYEKI